MGDIRVLTFKGQQSGLAEDLFHCKENGKTYIRQEANCDNIVFWFTANKWQGGYEADSPLREGLTMRVVDTNGNIMFEETLKKDEWNGGTSAEKKYEFSYEHLSRISAELERKFALLPHEEWKKWLLADKESSGYCGYDDNWLYCTDDLIERKCIEKIKTYDGTPAFFVKQTYKHRISGKMWSSYEIAEDRNADLIYCLVGYELE